MPFAGSSSSPPKLLVCQTWKALPVTDLLRSGESAGAHEKKKHRTQISVAFAHALKPFLFNGEKLQVEQICCPAAV